MCVVKCFLDMSSWSAPPLTSRTSWSTPWPPRCIWPCLSWKCERSQAPEDRLGWGRRAESRLITAPENGRNYFTTSDKKIFHLGYCERWRPLRAENVQTNRSIWVYIRMINSCGECKLWRLEWVVCRKVNVEEKHSSFIWRLWRSKNSGLDQKKLQLLISRKLFQIVCYLPVKRIISNRSCWALGWWVIADVLQLFVDPLERHDEAVTGLELFW